MNFINKDDQDNRIKKIIKDTEFFEKGKYQPFDKDITNNRFTIKPENINEINIKCYGYGYFEEEGNRMQTQLKKNLLDYLKAATFSCKNIKTLKLEFCGFSVDDSSLLKVLQIIEDMIRGKTPRETIWVHTRFLKECESTTIQEMLNLTDQLAKCNFQEISVVMCGWQFKGAPLPYNQLEEIFGTFGKNLAPPPRSPLKRIKIDISSWYMHNLEAYQLLAKALPENYIAEGIQSSRTEQAKKKKDLKIDPQQTRKMILDYLKNLQEKYRIENPVPGKGPRYFKEDQEYERRKLQYIATLMRQGINREDLKRVYKESGMPQQHKQHLKQIEKDVHEQYKAQKNMIDHHQEVIAETNRHEKEISATFIKFPFDHVMAERVNAFHKLIIAFVSDIQQNLESIEQFQLDMRNWNGLFQMNDLKKMLDKQFAQMGAMKLIGNAFAQVMASLAPDPSEEEGSKLKLSFLM